MREMHKWKDKVELSLDNRQIFFLFFGLSVVGCFVFALGVMVGRRVDFDTVAQADDEPAGLALLDADATEPPGYVAALRGDAEPPPMEPMADAAPAVDAAPPADAEPAKPGSKTKAPSKADAPKAPVGKPDAAAAAAAAPTMAAGKPAAADIGRKFTLQMKAFAKPDEAEVFAAPLRGNGHDIRVEAHEIKGRVWHRVRMGEFETWEEGLAAKGEFEKSEKTIAYVVRL